MPNMFLAFVLILGVLGGLNASIIDSRIVGGAPVTTPIRYVVSVQNINLQHLCGGTIVNRKWVLTSATCANTAGVKYVLPGETLSTNHEFVFHVSNIIRHPYFDALHNLNDIALLKTLQSFEYGDRVGAANLPTYDLGTGYQMTIAGWGIYNKGSTAYSNSLQSLTVRSMSKDECRVDIVPKIEIYDLQICGIRSTGKGVCTGDSGSGVVYGGCIHGIVSATPSRLNCGNGYPEVFTRVRPLVSWINDVISGN